MGIIPGQKYKVTEFTGPTQTKVRVFVFESIWKEQP